MHSLSIICLHFVTSSPNSPKPSNTMKNGNIGEVVHRKAQIFLNSVSTLMTDTLGEMNKKVSKIFTNFPTFQYIIKITKNVEVVGGPGEFAVGNNKFSPDLFCA